MGWHRVQRGATRVVGNSAGTSGASDAIQARALAECPTTSTCERATANSSTHIKVGPRLGREGQRLAGCVAHIPSGGKSMTGERLAEDSEGHVACHVEIGLRIPQRAAALAFAAAIMVVMGWSSTRMPRSRARRPP